MIAESLLFSSLAVGGAGAVYLLHHTILEKKARDKQRREQEAHFRNCLLHELRRPVSSPFRLSEFSARCEIPRDVADRIADEIYGALYRKSIAGASAVARHGEKLKWLSEALELGVTRAGLIETKVKEDAYEKAVDGVLADGTVTNEEVTQLEQLRRQMGISKEKAFDLTEDSARSAYLTTFRRIVHDGVITQDEQHELLRCKNALALSDDQASEAIRVESLNLYKQLFSTVIQDGIVTPEEEQSLTWLQGWSGLRDSDLVPYHDRLREVKRLGSLRKGVLPTVPTRMILEGGETCHWQGPCTLEFETRTKSIRVGGELAVTSKNLYFMSPSKSLSFSPARILDIIRRSNGLEIKVNARQGSGRYLTPKAEELEATLVGAVSKHKFLLGHSYSSEKTRHIPDEVKRSVWDRDGGKCTRCAESSYLEFDHIIPHSRGGANTVNNVQILCRNCNILKSNRI